MSRFTGPIRQFAFVVENADAAMEFWTRTMGVGPFLVRRKTSFEDFLYRGKPSPAPVVTLCFAQAGASQIEIIEQHNDVPSAYREFLSAGHSGFQHVASWFSSHEAYDAAYNRLMTEGLTVVHQGKGIGVDARFSYFSGGDNVYPHMELAQALMPGFTFAETVERAAQNWDGAGPIRGMDGKPE